MAEIVAPYALTTKDRIKTRLGIDKDTTDILINRLISGVTDFIESQTNRRFKSTTYTNEVYNVKNAQNILILKHAPVTALSSFQYSQGLPNVRIWTDVNPADYELDANNELGIIRAYFTLTRGISTYRVTYTAGYLIDWDSVGNSNNHTLPFDITELAEKLVSKVLQKRMNVGKSTETVQGNTVTWQKELDPEDLLTLQKYIRQMFI